MDWNKIINDFRLIAQGIRTKDWLQVLSAIADILKEFSGSKPALPLVEDHAALFALSSMDPEALASHFDSLATQFEAMPQDALGDRLKKLMPFLIDLFKKVIGGLLS